jgi:hypothetical protein
MQISLALLLLRIAILPIHDCSIDLGRFTEDYTGKSFKLYLYKYNEERAYEPTEVYCKPSSIIAQYDISSITERLGEDIQEFFESVEKHSSPKINMSEQSEPSITAFYEFKNCPDFMLLRFQVAKNSYDVFVGIIKTSKEWYVLSDNYGYSLRESYNAMISKYPDVLTLQDKDKSLLLISMKYATRPIALIESEKALDIALALFYRIGDIHLTWADLPPEELYISNFSNNPSLIKYTVIQDSVRAELFNQISSNCKSSMAEPEIFHIEPATIIDNNNVKTVRLTILADYFGELATWKVVFTNEGFIKDIGYIGRAVYGCPTFRRRLESPFFQKGRELIIQQKH